MSYIDVLSGIFLLILPLKCNLTEIGLVDGLEKLSLNVMNFYSIWLKKFSPALLSKNNDNS